MARINIEEKLFSDARFKALVRKLGHERHATGMLVDAYILGQRYWAKDRSLIPIAEWKLADLDVLFEVFLAEQRGEYVYIKGAEQHFEWYYQKIQSAKKGGAANAKRFGKIEAIALPIGEAIGSPSACLWDSPPTPTPTPKIQNTCTSTGIDLPKHSSDELLAVWNAYCGSLAKAQAMTAKRKKSANARLKENPDLGYWREVIEKMAVSDFCNGKSGGTWKANLDFLLKPDTHLKVMEGMYDNRYKTSEIKLSDNDPY